MQKDLVLGAAAGGSGATPVTLGLRHNRWVSTAAAPAELEPRTRRAGLWPMPSRANRVFWLLVAVFLMSLADLDISMVYLRSVGMAEVNPVARYVMEWNQPWLLVLWKVASILFSCSVLFVARRLAAAEIAAWVCFIALAWLTCQWWAYTAEAHVLTPALSGLSGVDTARWVQMGN